MDIEKIRIRQSLVIPFFLLAIMWLVKIIEWQFSISFSSFGVRPLQVSGLPGILFSPLLHADFKHLFSNSLPFLFLGGMLYYFYKEAATPVLLLSWVFTGLLVWLMARRSVHIGASGVVYALATFHFVSGLIRRNPGLMAVSMLVIFLYGSMVWGIFPQFFPGQNISWESHLSGILTGLVFALWFKDIGPQKIEYHWDDDDDTESANPEEMSDSISDH